MSARLFLEKGPGAPAVFELPEGESVTVGRNLSNNIVLPDEHASRWHAVIVHKDGRWTIRNVDARNGTRLGDHRISEETEINDGQEIIIGNSWLRFSLQDNTRVPTAVEPVPPAMPETSTLQVDELTALCSLMSLTVEEVDPRAMIQASLQTVLDQTGANVVGFLSLDPDQPFPKIVLPTLARVDFQMSRYLTRCVQQEGRPVWLKPSDGNTGESDSLALFTDALCVPLHAEQTPLGALHAYKTGKYFSERDLHFCEILAGYLAGRLRLLRVRRNLEAENVRLRGRSADSEEIVGRTPVIMQLHQLIARAASRPSTILISGESGVGKELVAIALHRQSSRHEGPLVVLNCAAIAPTLIEAELFGHCKGAFTGAEKDRPGLFQQADEGTLFLDEVGELPLDCQAKLLRVLEGRPFRPVGGTVEIRTDVRIIGATNRDLQQDVHEGRFREDLFFRLKVIPIRVPPLRERIDDIPILAEHFLSRFAADAHHPLRLSPAALGRLQAYTWPGNIRQLRSVLECSVALTDKETLDAVDILLPTETAAESCPPSLNLDELETWAIRRALKQTDGNITQAARLLGVVRDTLRSMIVRKGISKEECVE